MSPHTQNQRERLNYLEFRAYFTGQVSRSDLINRFGISEAAATRDLAIYREQVLGNLEFDTTTKIYRITPSFSLHYLKEVDAGRLLQALAYGVGNDFGATPDPLVPCELPASLQVPPADITATVSRAIFQKAVLGIEYFSGSGNHGPREIVPFSLTGTGLKWMVRAFCRRKNIFSDFVLTRIKSAEVIQGSRPGESETKDNDDEWNRMLKLELVPHPSKSPQGRAMIEKEFKMADGVHVLRVRAALAGFYLNLWSVDCSETQGLKTHPLALRNLLALHDVDSAKLAPGYIRVGTP